LLESQATKAYVGIQGNVGFLQSFGELLFPELAFAKDYTAVQTLGGTGGVRLALDLVHLLTPNSTVWVPSSTWGNHYQLIKASGLRAKTYNQQKYHSSTSAALAIDDLAQAQSGDCVIFHGCCHNPTGIDYSEVAQDELFASLAGRGIIPIIDAAYIGFGAGFSADAARIAKIIRRFPESFVAVSCSKNIGLYRERLGACFAFGESKELVTAVQGHLESLARGMYSMPADHGASVVEIILKDQQLCEHWLSELEAQRQHIKQSRAKLSDEITKAGGDFDTSYIANGNGMFCLFPMVDTSISRLREVEGIYIGPGGRLNIAALADADVTRVALGLTGSFDRDLLGSERQSP